MKRIKYFVLSLLVCFSFGCVQRQNAELNLKFLLLNTGGIEKYSCVRTGIESPFICVLKTEANETKLVRCDNDGCVFKNCSNDEICFQSNDTE